MFKFDNSIALLILILIAFIAYLTRCTCTDRFIVSSGAAGRAVKNVKSRAVAGWEGAMEGVADERDRQELSEALARARDLNVADAVVAAAEHPDLDETASAAAMEALQDAIELQQEHSDYPQLWAKINYLEGRLDAANCCPEEDPPASPPAQPAADGGRDRGRS